jgi:hypothetical protein
MAVGMTVWTKVSASDGKDTLETGMAVGMTVWRSFSIRSEGHCHSVESVAVEKAVPIRNS